MPPEARPARPRPLVRVERIVTGKNGATVSIVVHHEAGRPSDALRLIDEAAASVKARVTS